jgi:hypothetical protein
MYAYKEGVAMDQPIRFFLKLKEWESEFVELWALLRNVTLQRDESDSIFWRWSADDE